MKTLGKTVLSLADGNDVTITVTEGSYGNDYNVHMDFSEDWSVKKNDNKRVTLDDLKISPISRILSDMVLGPLVRL